MKWLRFFEPECIEEFFNIKQSPWVNKLITSLYDVSTKWTGAKY